VIYSRACPPALTAWILVLAAISCCAFAGMPTASATPRTVVVNTGSGNLDVRAQPSTSAQLLGTIRNGTKMVITCFVHGQVFAGGPFGGASDIWNKREGAGFVTDRMLDTGSDAPVVPPCPAADAR
jgi:hypothetical protein